MRGLWTKLFPRTSLRAPHSRDETRRLIILFVLEKVVIDKYYTKQWSPLHTGVYSMKRRKAIETYRCMLPTTRASRQISDVRSGMRQRALFVQVEPALHWNEMLLARENVDSLLAAMVVATEHTGSTAYLHGKNGIGGLKTQNKNVGLGAKRRLCSTTFQKLEPMPGSRQVTFSCSLVPTDLRTRDIPKGNLISRSKYLSGLD